MADDKLHNVRKVAFHTLGCKVNQVDTDGLAGAFIHKGYQIVEFDDRADVYIINTCTVTNTADRKSRQQIRRALKRNPGALVVATGCLSQTEGASLAIDIPGLALISGTRGRTDLADRIDSLLSEKYLGSRVVSDPIVSVASLKTNGNLEYEDYDWPLVTERTRAYIKVEEGCQEYCSYCRIPYARGPVLSRKLDSIVRETENLAARGFREIVLTGIHLGHYGRDLDYATSLADVIKTLISIEGLDRIRLGSIDSTDITPELLRTASGSSKICRQFHIPLQGGHDQILRAMNRKYTLEEYADTIQRLRDSIPGVAITTDIIVGFPGETEEHFQSTLDFVRRVAFSKLHVFRYSKRKGTPAASFPNQVAEEIKEARSERLIALGEHLAQEFNRDMIGSVVKVLAEEYESESGTCRGFTDTYVRASFNVKHITSDPTGKMYEIIVTEAMPEGVSGKCLEESTNICRR